MEYCKKCGGELNGGGFVCPMYKGPIHSEHCQECRFHMEAGICYETCLYHNRLKAWKRLNVFYMATPVMDSFIYDTLKVGDMSDDMLLAKYNQMTERFKSNIHNPAARHSNSETLYVLAKEIEKRGLF